MDDYIITMLSLCVSYGIEEVKTEETMLNEFE